MPWNPFERKPRVTRVDDGTIDPATVVPSRPGEVADSTAPVAPAAPTEPDWDLLPLSAHIDYIRQRAGGSGGQADIQARREHRERRRPQG